MLEIPAELNTATDVFDAVAAYDDWRGSIRPRDPWGLFGFNAPKVPKLAAGTTPALRQLALDPGPPPVVYAQTGHAAQRRVPSKPAAVEQRPRHVVHMPKPAKAVDWAALSEDPQGLLWELCDLAIGAHIVRTFSARVSQLSDLESAQGRARQSQAFAVEASELDAFVGEYEAAAIPTYGAAWLDHWRGLSVRYTPPAPSKPKRPPLRAASLR